MEVLKNINWTPVFVVAILNFILAVIWYSPALFGDAWAKAYGFSKSDMQPTILKCIAGLIISLLTVAAFGLLVSWFHIDDMASGLRLGAVIWLGFIVPTYLSEVIWAKRPIESCSIDIPFRLLSLSVIGAILAVWH